MDVWWPSMDSNNWDLQAVVRGCSGGAFSSPSPSPPPPPPRAAASASRDPLTDATLDDLMNGDDLSLGSFPDPAAAQTALHELEELCRPFFSRQQDINPFAPPPPLPPQREIRRPATALTQSPRNPGKRKKNQQKKVVRQVPADGLPSDMWAWRKYGQKPIKGSPYPRGYYRCSSSKGCPARKQVERSRADPTMLIITYTSEHNHPVPTHRNSLAGSTRNKSPSNNPPSDENNRAESSPLSAPGLSPTTPLASLMEENEDDDLGSTGTARIGDADDDMLFFDSDPEFVKEFLSEPWLGSCSDGGS